MNMMRATRFLCLLASILVVAACAGGGGGGGSSPSPRDDQLTQEILSRYAANGMLLGFSMRELNANGILTRVGNYTANGALLNYQTWSYDAAGRANRIGFYNVTGALLRYEALAYDGNGRQSHRGFYNASGALTRFEAYDYDSRGRRDYRGFYDASANLTGYELYSYTASVVMDPSRIDFYDAAGNLAGFETRSYYVDLRLNHTGFYDATGSLTRYRAYTYNARKQLTHVATYDAEDNPMGWDSYGYGDVSPPAAPPTRPDPPKKDIPNADDRPPPTSEPKQDLPQPPAIDPEPPRRATTPPRPIEDEDDDLLADVVDNCPFFKNANQTDADDDGIGDVCEATSVMNLVALTDGLTTVNLSWTNPTGARLGALNLSYRRSDGAGNPIVLDITKEVNLTAGAAARYRISGLSSATNYTFAVGGFDDRHGRMRQPLPLARVDGTTAAQGDLDNDGILDDADNCPRTTSANRLDSDGDGIGDICETEPVSNLGARPDDRNATIAHLTWQNPIRSRLTALNISYRRRDGEGASSIIQIMAGVDLAPGATVTRLVAGLDKDTNYTLTVGGIDARHGFINQFLPPARVDVTTPADSDGDAIRDEADNCPLLANPGQEDGDNDQIGDVCEARPVTDLTAVADGLHAMNLSWTNPQDSVLRAMNLTYGPPHDPTANVIDLTGQVNLSAGARVFYPVAGLDAGTTYTFTLSGIDFRHGRRAQTLEPVSRDETTLPDEDEDGITDAADNCPDVANAGQGDDDEDGIGDACEAEAVMGLEARPDGETAMTLGWTNPTGSKLRRLNITWGPKDAQERSVRMITAEADLAPGASATARFTGLSTETNYTFTLSGLDARHGRRDQIVPPTTLIFNSLDRDGDGVLDGKDNCIFTPNPDQTPRSSDPTYGDACGPDHDGDGAREIQTADQLNASRDHPAASYELATDIDLANDANWIPILSFSGALNGNGYTISNLSINSSAPNVGLFGDVTGQASIRNITLRVVNIRVSGTNTAHVGGLVGSSPTPSDVNIEDFEIPTISDAAVIIEGNLTGAAVVHNYVGGFLGDGSLDLSNSYVLVLGGTISGAGIGDSYVGGLVGRYRAGKIQNSYALVLGGGSIKSVRGRSGIHRVGGLVGGHEVGSTDAAAQLFFYNNSYVAINGTISTAMSPNAQLGGLAGSYNVLLAPSNSYFAAPVAEALGSISDNQPPEFGSGLNRTLRQLECPTAAGATCAGATTYINWDSAIWDFGDAQTLPDLRSRPRPPDLRDPLP